MAVSSIKCALPCSQFVHDNFSSPSSSNDKLISFNQKSAQHGFTLHLDHSSLFTSLPYYKSPKHSVSNKKNLFFSLNAVASVAGESPAMVAKEMERVAAKEALILAAKDAGGVEALSSGEGNTSNKIEVSEKVLALERLNPTPRPTTSPLLEGVWEFVWAGSRSPGLMAARILLKRFPEQVAKFESLNLEILQGGTRATASVKLLSSVETSFTLSTRLAVEGPLRLKEEYIEGVLSTPSISDSDLPSPLKSIIDQIQSLSNNLPEGVKEALNNGLKLPLGNTFERELLISYLDDEVMVVRDQFGLPDVLVRVMAPAPDPGMEGVYDVEMPE